MRPVIRGAQPAGYVVPPTFTFTGKNAAVMRGFFKTASPTVAQCLGLWDQSADKVARGVALTANETAAKTAIVARIGPVYRAAGPLLLAAIGGFCSYCESPLPGQLDVEHAMPKDPYPVFCLNWDNFLVGCTACNTAKLNRPIRRQVLLALQTGPPPNANPTSADFYAAVRTTSYLWPDLEPRSYRMLPVQFGYVDSTGASHLLAPADAVSPHLAEVARDPVTQTVTANVVDAGVPHPNVTVVARPTGTTLRAAAMVELCGLQKTGGTITDRRVYNRTLAWLKAARNINRVLQAPSAAERDARAVMLLDLAASSGFYSVWLSLVCAAHASSGPQFVTQTNNASYFPGTNPASLP